MSILIILFFFIVTLPFVVYFLSIGRPFKVIEVVVSFWVMFIVGSMIFGAVADTVSEYNGTYMPFYLPKNDVIEEELVCKEEVVQVCDDSGRVCESKIKEICENGS